MAAIKVFGSKALIGGAEGALDANAYADLSDQDVALTIILTGAAAVLYVHAFDASSALAESSPDVVAPDDVAANNGRWILAGTTLAAVTGGSIDGPVGGVTPAAGTFTTGTITTADINGGAIDGAVIGGAVPAAGTFTTGTITTADINGGAIDGAAVGGAVPAAGTFTTLIGTSIDGPIGGVTPAAGAFTTLIGTSIDGPVGGVTPAAGAFTTVNIDGGTIDDVEYVEVGGSTAGTDGYLKVISVTDAAVFEIIADDDSPNCVFGTSTDNSVHIMVNSVRNATFAATYFRPAVNDQKSLGDASHLWTAVYATNGTIQTSTAKLKADIKETPLGLDFVLALQPKEFKWADHEVPAVLDIKGRIKEPAYIKTHTNKHHGFVAEDVAAVMQEKQVEFAGLATVDGEPSGLNYAEFIAPMVKAIQKLEARVAALEKK